MGPMIRGGRHGGGGGGGECPVAARSKQRRMIRLLRSTVPVKVRETAGEPAGARAPPKVPDGLLQRRLEREQQDKEKVITKPSASKPASKRSRTVCIMIQASNISSNFWVRQNCMRSATPARAHLEPHSLPNSTESKDWLVGVPANKRDPVGGPPWKTILLLS